MALLDKTYLIDELQNLHAVDTLLKDADGINKFKGCCICCQHVIHVLVQRDKK